MIKFLLHELKKNLWLVLLLTAICVFPYITVTATMAMTEQWWVPEDAYETVVASPNLWMVSMQLVMLTFVAPVAVYSFKMNKRSVDCFYAMPIKREKLLLVKTLVGLAILVIPFTLSYWSGFLVLLLRQGNPYQMLWYFPAYLAFLGYGILIFGWHAFLYTRANKPFDGIVFLLGYTFVFCLAGFVVVSAIGWKPAYDYFTSDSSVNYFGFGPAIAFCGNFEQLICGESVDSWLVETFLSPVLLGGVGYGLSFGLERFQKAENAEQVSNDWAGYKTLIPVYTACFLAMAIVSESAVLSCVCVAFSFVATVVWRRKFRIGKIALIVFAVGIALGIILGILMTCNMPY